MKTYARIENNKVAEVVSLDIAPEKLYHPSLKWVDITALGNKPAQNDDYKDGVFTAQVIEVEGPVFFASSQLTGLMAEAGQVIAPLQDAVDVGMANDEEATRLAAWKKYRVLLSRVDTNKAPDITWPVKPE